MVKSGAKKVRIFAWRAKLGRIPTRTVLDRMRMDLESVLYLRCGNEVETVHHALVQFSEVSVMWNKVLKWWNHKGENIGSFQELMNLNLS